MIVRSVRRIGIAAACGGFAMNLEYAVDKLYETGWQPEASDVQRLPDGRAYPSVAQVQQLFAAQGFELLLRYVQLFDCYRAVWTDRTGTAQGAVVGADDCEAAVYALAQLRRARHATAAKP